MKIYIAGPMRGWPDRNFPLFDEAAVFVRALGHSPSNPADHSRKMGAPSDKEPTEEHTQTLLAWDFRELLDCVGIVLLPGWEGSTGASAEEMIARLTGMPRYLWGDRRTKKWEPLVLGL